MPDTAGLTLFASGALCAGYLVAALCFARFLRRTGAPIFRWFTAAFLLLALQRLLLVVVVTAPGAMPWSYVVRLLAFVLILVGIAAQNRPRRAAAAPR
jgi:hypothetical protein